MVDFCRRIRGLCSYFTIPQADAWGYMLLPLTRLKTSKISLLDYTEPSFARLKTSQFSLLDYTEPSFARLKTSKISLLDYTEPSFARLRTIQRHGIRGSNNE